MPLCRHKDGAPPPLSHVPSLRPRRPAGNVWPQAPRTPPPTAPRPRPPGTPKMPAPAPHPRPPRPGATKPALRPASSLSHRPLRQMTFQAGVQRRVINLTPEGRACGRAPPLATQRAATVLGSHGPPRTAARRLAAHSPPAAKSGCGHRERDQPSNAGRGPSMRPQQSMGDQAEVARTARLATGTLRERHQEQDRGGQGWTATSQAHAAPTP